MVYQILTCRRTNLSLQADGDPYIIQMRKRLQDAHRQQQYELVIAIMIIIAGQQFLYSGSWVLFVLTRNSRVGARSGTPLNIRAFAYTQPNVQSIKYIGPED